MNEAIQEVTDGTATRLISAGIQLFAERGYDGTTVRAVTRRAGANLGAITYHFGTKDEFYEAVVTEVVDPSREFLANAVGTQGSPLDRIERFVRGVFEYLRLRPEFPRLVMQHFAGARPLPDAFRRVIQANARTLLGLIEQGQRDGSIRSGDPRLMTPSIISQPMYITLARQIIQEGLGIDYGDPDAWAGLVDAVVDFVRAGLASQQEGTS